MCSTINTKESTAIALILIVNDGEERKYEKLTKKYFTYLNTRKRTTLYDTKTKYMRLYTLVAVPTSETEKTRSYK